MNVNSIIGRHEPLFLTDMQNNETELTDTIKSSKFLVIGGAGSIGKAVTLELFRRNPSLLHVVDISENNLVELVRTVRSSFGYGTGEFRTFALDFGSPEFQALCNDVGNYDYIFNLAALKHVRSEKDPYTLMRMINVNIFNTISSLQLAERQSSKRFFCVSTDKAANPANMMGASKQIMELFLRSDTVQASVSMARFANVAFSDGSLLHGFNQRYINRQPITAPRDIRRYFITPSESGELCLLAGLMGGCRDIFFPKLNSDLHLTKFSDIAVRYLESHGFESFECFSEEEARLRAKELIPKKKWPVFFFESDTTGEKGYEEFYTADENVDFSTYATIGVIKKETYLNGSKLSQFLDHVLELKTSGSWQKEDLVNLFQEILPDFNHIEKNKNLDERM